MTLDGMCLFNPNENSILTPQRPVPEKKSRISSAILDRARQDNAGGKGRCQPRPALLCRFCPNSTHAKNLGVVFRFVVSKQLVDVSTHVIFR